MGKINTVSLCKITSLCLLAGFAVKTLADYSRYSSVQNSAPFSAMGPEGFQRASGKPFGRLRRGEILYVCKRTMHDLQNDKAKYFANKRNGRGSIKAWNRGRFYASYQLFSKKGVPSSCTRTSRAEKCRGTGLVIRYNRITSMRTLSWKVTREKLTPCLWARPVRPMRWR